jgi:hypothetical protein
MFLRERRPYGLLVPALIQSIQATHERSDAEFLVYYLVSA